MPRSPDPALEGKLVAAALSLLDRGGEPAITLRAVAKEAGTTTPSIYERFRSREALMRRLVDEATNEIVAILQPKASVEAMFDEYLRYSRAHPMRLNLMVTTFGARFVAGDEMPAFELLKLRIADQVGIKGRPCEDLALAIASLAFGTAQGVIAAGKGTRQAAEFHRTSRQALRMLLAAFCAANKGRPTARRAKPRSPASR